MGNRQSAKGCHRLNYLWVGLLFTFTTLLISSVHASNRNTLIKTHLSQDSSHKTSSKAERDGTPSSNTGAGDSTSAVNRRRSSCRYDGIDLLQTANRHRVEFSQSVYILTDVLVNTTVGTSLLELVANYKGRLPLRNPVVTHLDDRLQGGPSRRIIDKPGFQTKYNMSSDDDTFALKHLYSLDSKAFYSLVLSRPLRYFVNPQHRYQFKINAYSPNEPSLYSRAWVQISLRNFNCHAPTFISDDSFSVSQIVEKGHIVGVVQANDPDGDRVSYIQKNLFDQYAVDKQSGVITVTHPLTTPSSDKLIKFHELRIVAEDDALSCTASGLQCPKRQNETVVKIVISDVNLYSPEFTSSICGQTIEIPEHMDVDRPITTLSARDRDRGQNGHIEFFFPDASSSKNNAYQKFRLGPHTQIGSVRNVSIYATESFDYDAPHAIHTFFLLIFAQDSGHQRRQGFCFLKVTIADKNDNKPVFVMTRWDYQLRNTSHLIGRGQRLFRVIAFDKDSGENGRVQYFQHGSSNKYFDIERESGFVKFRDSDAVLNLIAADFPQTFEVFATDSAVPNKRSQENAKIVIKLSGSDDAELEWGREMFNDFAVNVSEKFHSKYGLAHIRDAKFDGNITFIGYGHIANPRFHLSPRPEDSLFVASKTRLVGPLSNVNGANKFTAGIRLTNELDAEVKDIHYLYLRVEDIQGLQSLVGLCKVFVRDENDQIPFFDSSELRISLLEGNWTEEISIGRVQAFDQDRTYPNNYVRYRLRQGESDEIRRMFSVHETGEIVAHGYFDRETKSSWNFYVESYDGVNGYGLNEPNTDSVAVRVEVIDVNDNRPQFTEKSIQITISELFETGRSMIQLTCEDPDYESHLQFHIIDGNQNGHFAIRRSEVQSSQIRQTADLIVVGHLDYTLSRTYRLRVMASDSLNSDEIIVEISVTPAECRAPTFEDNPPYNAHVAENIAAHDFIVLSARAHDTSEYSKPDNHAIRSSASSANHIEMSIVDPDLYPDFKLSGNRISIIRGLDRDPPKGRPFWIVPIKGVNDADMLFTFTNVNVTVEDVNDNGPSLVEDDEPFVLMEKHKNPSFKFRLIDVDDWSLGHGGPFKQPIVVASTFGSPRNFSISHIVNSPRQSPTYTMTYTGGLLERTPSLKQFYVTIAVRDATDVGGRLNVPIVIGDKNDHQHQDGEKAIYVHRYLYHTRSLHGGLIGNVFVEDVDDWDIDEKAFTGLPENQLFDVDHLGRISINELAARYMDKGEYEFKVDVFDRMFGTSVTGIVDVVLRDISEKDVRNAVHLRLSGFNAHEFVERRSTTSPSYLDLLAGNLTALFGIKPSSVMVVNVKDHGPGEMDVYFVVKGFGRSLVEKKLRQTTYLHQLFRIRSIAPNPCSPDDSGQPEHKCPANMVCQPVRITSAVDFELVDTNRSALAGLRIENAADCVCSDYFGTGGRSHQLSCSSSGGYCRNGGRCKREEPPSAVWGHEFVCECPFGFEGPRCEALERNFEKKGFAKFRALAYCQPSRLHLEFSSLSEAKAGLLLLNGDPFGDVESDKYFLAVQIVNGSLVVHLGANAIVRLGDDLFDGNWHHLDIEQIGKVAKVTIDQCDSKTVQVNEDSRARANADYQSSVPEMAYPMRDNQDEALYLGGLPQHLRIQDVFRHVLAVHEFDGCLRNVMIDGQYLDLFIPQNLEGSQYTDSWASTCPCRHHIYCDISLMPRAFAPSIPWWIWLLILAIIFITTTSLAITLIASMRRRNDMFLRKCYSAGEKRHFAAVDTDDSGCSENLINYGDGAGEQDQTCFDINILKKPLIESKTISRASPMSAFANDHIRERGSADQVETDQRDSLIIFADEGLSTDCNRNFLDTISCTSSRLSNRQSVLEAVKHCKRDSLIRLAALFANDESVDSSSSSSLFTRNYVGNRSHDGFVGNLINTETELVQPLLLPVEGTEIPSVEGVQTFKHNQSFFHHEKNVSVDEQSHLVSKGSLKNGWDRGLNAASPILNRPIPSRPNRNGVHFDTVTNGMQNNSEHLESDI